MDHRCKPQVEWARTNDAYHKLILDAINTND